MKKKIRFILPIAALMTATATGYLVAQDKKDEAPAPALVIEPDSRPIERLGGSNPTSYAPMLEKTTRAVVGVYTSEIVSYGTPSGNFQQQDMLRRLFGGGGNPRFNNGPQGNSQNEREVPQGEGSGVIISADGYILTNNHVVMDSRGGDADKIMIRLSDDTEMEAKLIGRDPKTDIAVIKVDGVNLPVAKIADSDQVKVGDIVFAIGNPLGVGLTVTSGIISATGKSIGIYGNEGYEDFLQTDAAINPGNSGGALVDIEGRLIGINSAIVSRSGGSVGLGFSIPTNLATNITRQLTDSGEVRRGLIGVGISPLTSDVAEAMGVKGTRGVLIERVEAGFPAEKAGLKHGDIITQVDSRKVTDVADLRLAISRVMPGNSTELVALRDGKELIVNVEVTSPETAATVSQSTEFIEGIAAAPLTDEARQSYGIPQNISGLVITESSSTSPFSRYLSPGLVILEINKRAVSNLSEARQALRERGNNLLYVYDRGRTSYFALRLDS